MNTMPTPTVDTNPVGRHGRVGVEILPRDIEYPRFDRVYVEEAMAIVATNGAAHTAPEVPATSGRTKAVAQEPDKAPGWHL